MWLGRCACGRDMVAPTALVERVVRLRMFLRRQRLGPRPFREPGHWAYGLIGLVGGIFVGMVIGVGARPAEPRPLYLGDFVKAEHFNDVAATLNCAQVDAVDGELLDDAMRRLGRCVRKHDATGVVD